MRGTHAIFHGLGVAVSLLSPVVPPSNAPVGHDPPSVEISGFRRAIARGASAGPAYLEIAKLERSMGHFEGALTALAHAEAAGASEPAVALERSGLLLDRGDDQAARCVLDAAIANDPFDPSLRRARAIARERACDPRGAVSDARLARDLDPSSFSMDDALRLARMLEATGDSSAAVASLEYALEIHGPSAILVLRVAELELESRRFNAALAAIDRLQRAGVAPFDIALRRGEVLERAGRSERARAEWHEARALLDRLPAARRRAPAIRGRYREVIRLVEESDRR